MDATVERIECEVDEKELENQVGPDLTASFGNPADADHMNGGGEEPDILRASLSDVVFNQTLTLSGKGDAEDAIDEKDILDIEFDNVIMAGDVLPAFSDAGDGPAFPNEESAKGAVLSLEASIIPEADQIPETDQGDLVHLAILGVGDPTTETSVTESPATTGSMVAAESPSVTDSPAVIVDADDFDDAIDPTVVVPSLNRGNDSDDEFDFDLPETKTKSASDKTVRFSSEIPADSGDNQNNESKCEVDVQEGQRTEQSLGELKGTDGVGSNALFEKQSDGLGTSHHLQPGLKTEEISSPISAHLEDVEKSEEANDRSHIITSSAADWDNVETVEAGFSDHQPGEGGGESMSVAPALLSFSDAWQHFRSLDHSLVKDKIQISVERRGFSAFVRFLFGPPKLHRDLQAERELVFCIAATALDNGDSVHTQSLQTVYRILTGSRFNCQRFGSHWEEIGFQGRDPATDLRGTGMLALTQLVYFLQDPSTAQLARDIYKLSLHPTQNFPFCVMCINISRICLQSLREDILNKECNRQKAIMCVVNQFYAGALLHLYRLWKQGKTISDSGFVIKEVETRCKKNAKDVFRDLQTYIAAQKPAADPSEAGDGDLKFFSVVSQDKTKSAAELY